MIKDQKQIINNITNKIIIIINNTICCVHLIQKLDEIEVLWHFKYELIYTSVISRFWSPMAHKNYNLINISN